MGNIIYDVLLSSLNRMDNQILLSLLLQQLWTLFPFFLLSLLWFRTRRSIFPLTFYCLASGIFPSHPSSIQLPGIFLVYHCALNIPSSNCLIKFKSLMHSRPPTTWLQCNSGLIFHNIPHLPPTCTRLHSY